MTSSGAPLSVCQTEGESAFSTALTTKRSLSSVSTQRSSSAKTSRTTCWQTNRSGRNATGRSSIMNGISVATVQESSSSSCTCRRKSNASASLPGSTIQRRTGSSAWRTCESVATGTTTCMLTSNAWTRPVRMMRLGMLSQLTTRGTRASLSHRSSRMRWSRFTSRCLS